MHTGDIGHLDDEGYLYFFDRAADVIETGGRKVSTLHVENALYEHPGVRDACVVGLPDAERGQKVAAAIVLAREATAGDVMHSLTTRLAAHEIPTALLVDDFLPRGLIGKTLKREVRRWFADGDGEEARRTRRTRRTW